MYRDARPSLEARVRALEDQLDEASDEAERRRAEIAPLAVQLFPLFENLGDTMGPVRGDRGSGLMVLACLAVMSVPALPLAILWRPLRRDLRAARRADRRVKRLQSQLGEAQRDLRQLDGQSSASSPPSTR